MKELRRPVEVSITPTVNELASCFCDMDGDEQAIFFNKIAELVKDWHGTLSFQLHSISTSKYLNDEGRSVMREIGVFSDKFNDLTD